MFWEHQPNKELDCTVGRERRKTVRLQLVEKRSSHSVTVTQLINERRQI